MEYLKIMRAARTNNFFKKIKVKKKKKQRKMNLNLKWHLSPALFFTLLGLSNLRLTFRFTY
jgi:hypothetical protein